MKKLVVSEFGGEFTQRKREGTQRHRIGRGWLERPALRIGMKREEKRARFIVPLQEEWKSQKPHPWKAHIGSARGGKGVAPWRRD
jgi:hypothetical protein